MNKNWNRWWVVFGFILFGIALSGVGAIPIAVDDTAITTEDIAVIIDVLANDTGLEDIPITVSLSSAPAEGTISVNADNTITYTPNADFHGTDSFSYLVRDSNLESSEARVTVTVEPVNDAPVAVDDFVITPEDTPVSLTLKASDLDVDPYYPEDHPLQFVIVSGPTHGALSGDLIDIIYETPHTAYVSLTYTPTAGYVGSDSITFSVTDLFGASTTALIQIEVGGDREVGYLSGRWIGSLTMEGQTFSFTALSTTLTTVYVIGSFRVQGDATWVDDSFSSLRFSANFPLGELSIRSSLAFDPMGPDYFQYWQTTTRFDLFDIGFTHTFYLTDTQTTSYNQFVATGQIEDVSLTSTTKFTGLSFSFDSAAISARWNWATCDLDLDARLSITCEGFDEISFTARDISILPPELIGFGIYLRLEITFTTTSKELTTTLTCKSDWLDCFRILCEVIGEEMSIEGISLYGVQFEASFPGGIGFRSDTSLSEAKNSSLTGYSEYFERVRLWGPAESCCGTPGRWEIRTYFQSTHTTLFDWGMTTASLDLVLSDSIRFYTKLSFRSSDPTWEWTGGWDIRW